MTVQEAIDLLDNLDGMIEDNHNSDYDSAFKIAIKCMEEVEQYRSLGTVEEIKKKIKTELPYMSLAQARFKSELDEYRNIGTVEELKEARKKQVAKKPIQKKREHILHYECPCCGHTTLLPYCGNCGQAIDWGEEDD